MSTKPPEGYELMPRGTAPREDDLVWWHAQWLRFGCVEQELTGYPNSDLAVARLVTEEDAHSGDVEARFAEFKRTVHGFLDELGVPACEGVPCRIKARLQCWLHGRHGQSPVPESGWIPVSERLPTEEDARACGDRFAVTLLSGRPIVLTNWSLCDFKKEWNKDWSLCDFTKAWNKDRITAWMHDPLPDPHVPPEPEKPVREWEFCASCGGELDTGYECIKCGMDWVEFVKRDAIEELPEQKGEPREGERRVWWIQPNAELRVNVAHPYEPESGPRRRKAVECRDGDPDIDACREVLQELEKRCDDAYECQALNLVIPLRVAREWLAKCGRTGDAT